MQSSGVSVSVYCQSALGPLYLHCNPIKSLLTHEACVRLGLGIMLCLFLSNQGVHPCVHVYKCVRLCERQDAREREREREKWPRVYVHSYWCLVGVHVVTVDIMLTSSQSSLLVSLGLWAPVSSCFTYSCLLWMCFFLYQYFETTLSWRVYSPQQTNNTTSLQQRRWLDFLINSNFWLHFWLTNIH